MNLSDSIDTVPKVGPKRKAKLKKIGIKSVGDFLFHFPSKYEDFSQLTKIANLKPDRQVTIKGKLKSIETGKTSRKNIPYTQALIEDNTGAIKIIWFYQQYLKKSLNKGGELYISGEPTYGNEGLQFINPFYEKVKENTIHTKGLIPIYPETEGITSRWLRYALKPLLEKVGGIYETLPEQTLKEYNLLPIDEALRKIHFPDSYKQARAAQKRFAFERLFFIQLAALKKRISIKKENSTPIEVDMDYVKDFVNSLSFKLTDAQRKSSWQILQDIQRPHPMNRLLEGDVGSGKTVVATITTLATAKSGFQVAFMAPTEVLATQHFKKISRMLEDFKLNIGFLTGNKDKYRSKKLKRQFIEISREKLLEKVENGKIDVLIGTHALIQDKVTFNRLGLVIVDEQHRFGVKQRAKLTKKKDNIPHLLSMTATPIPRTLALTIYGDLDISIIDELPAGRKKIETKIARDKNRNEIYLFIKKELEEGRQAFFICPRIEKPEENDDSPWADVRSVEEVTEELEEEFEEFNVTALHGKISSTEKEKIMNDMKKGKIDILVSTSVIEVGVDIPEATVMVIEGAEMFGLAQLHQFRGRIGRNEYKSYCFLFSNSNSKKSRKRLKALVESENSFELAEKDLQLRGPGDLTGKRQWGVASFTMKALQNKDLVKKTKEAAKDILEEDPNLKNYPLAKRKLKSMKKNIHFE